MTYFQKQSDGRRTLAQLKALWRTMTEDERKTWVEFVQSSQDENMAPQKAFLKLKRGQS